MGSSGFLKKWETPSMMIQATWGWLGVCWVASFLSHVTRKHWRHRTVFTHHFYPPKHEEISQYNRSKWEFEVTVGNGGFLQRCRMNICNDLKPEGPGTEPGWLYMPWWKLGLWLPIFLNWRMDQKNNSTNWVNPNCEESPGGMTITAQIPSVDHGTCCDSEPSINHH